MREFAEANGKAPPRESVPSRTAEVSEQGTLPRYADTAGITIWARARLSENGEGPRQRDEPIEDEPEYSTALGGPARGRLDRSWWFGNDDDPADPHERSGALGSDCRSSEAAGDHNVERLALQRVPTGFLGTSGSDAHSIRPSEPFHRLAKELRTLGAPVEERQSGGGAAGGDHQTRNSPSATEIEHSGLAVLFLAASIDKGRGVLGMALQ